MFCFNTIANKSSILNISYRVCYNQLESLFKEGRAMPIVNVKLLEGRSDEQLKALVEEVTNAVEKTTNADRDAIQVIIEEMKKSHYAVGGVRKSEQS